MRIHLPLIMLSFLFGCTGYQYIASPSYVPLNTKKGDLKANVSYNHIQLGYSLTNHFSAFATGFIRNGGTAINFENWGTKEGGGANSYKDHSYEINLGMSYFVRVSNFAYELQLGGGGGKTYYEHEKDMYQENYFIEFNADKSNIFIQPSLSYVFKTKIDKIVQLGFFTKIVRDQFYNIRINTTLLTAPYNTPPDKEDAYFMNHNYRNLYFAEPGVCVRAGGRYVKGNAIVSVPFNLEGDNIRHRPINLYLSAFFNLNLLKKDKSAL
jgi:hypothetical protein